MWTTHLEEINQEPAEKKEKELDVTDAEMKLPKKHHRGQCKAREEQEERGTFGNRSQETNGGRWSWQLTPVPLA